MLTIRAEQMTAFTARFEQTFLESSVDFLKAEAPEVVENASPEELDSFVTECLRRARGHGIEDAYCVRQFMLFAAWRGPTFDEEPWARAILEDTRRAPLTRITRLEDHLASTLAEQTPGEPE
ncbi:hypothetical protein [Comamonas sp. JC664]|uniref:hypothetical protein n=1 Tax=Comamonas sp. JC664 TaxID=2801917 RepID=UPI00174825CE|nr:hypothetical protein [Comamonas sp. JC664]MBL0693477.1 hypothetical protein [Comamonas sp. JC664]GHG72736.1 hypothetical protein GCM10012319_18960 [Comamonas sp. KCTC 72670]